MYEILAALSNTLSVITGLPPETIRPETDLQKLKFAQWATLIMACEKHYHIEIPDEKAIHFACVQDVIDCIQQEMKDGRADYQAPTDEQRNAWYYE